MTPPTPPTLKAATPPGALLLQQQRQAGALLHLPPNPSSTALPSHFNGRARLSSPKPSEKEDPAAAEAEAVPAPLEDSLSRQTMQELLKPAAKARPELTFSARQAKENRRKEMMQMQRWMQMEMERSNKLAAPTPSHHKLMNQLSTKLAPAPMAYEQAIAYVIEHLSSGNSGGDDIAADVLKEAWQTASKTNKQRQAALHAEIAAARQRAERAEERAKELGTAVDEQKKQLEALPVTATPTIEVFGVVERVANPLPVKKAAPAPTPRPAPADVAPAVVPAASAAVPAPVIVSPAAADPPSLSEPPPKLPAAEPASELAAVFPSEAIELATAELREENEGLRRDLEEALRELDAAAQRAAAVEAAAAKAAEAELAAHAKAASAAAELEEAQGLLGQRTPRPHPEHYELRALLGEEDKVECALAALLEIKDMPVAELAALLTAPAIMEAPALPEAVIIPTEPSTAAAADGVESPPLQDPPAGESVPSDGGKGHAVVTIEVDEPSEYEEEVAVPSLYADLTACFAGRLLGAPPAALAEALSRAQGSTAQRYRALETHAARMQAECSTLLNELATHREAERRREAARRRREEEAALEKKNAVQQYLEMLASQGEDTWKEQLIGMGQGNEVPKLFRHSGKVRNKHMSKRDTEKLVKELWNERMNDPAVSAGRAGELTDFIANYLQKKVGIVAAVIELGYNFLYGLWLYQWDADCELFLRILTGEIREEVYLAQRKLQIDMEELFYALDKAKGQATGIIAKDELRVALQSFFRVGEAGGKTSARFDEVMQALETDQPGSTAEWKKIFEEDREFNQGEFAECLRDQFLQERIEFFSSLEVAIYEESGNEADCTREHVIRAIQATDPQCSERSAIAAAAAVFLPGVDTLSAKVVVKKLSKGILRGGGSVDSGYSGSFAVLPSGARMSTAGKKSIVVGRGEGGKNSIVLGRGEGGKNSILVGRGDGGKNSFIIGHEGGKNSIMVGGCKGKGGGMLSVSKKQSEGVTRALEAVRQDWINKTTKKNEEVTAAGVAAAAVQLPAQG